MQKKSEKAYKDKVYCLRYFTQCVILNLDLLALREFKGNNFRDIPYGSNLTAASNIMRDLIIDMKVRFQRYILG